VKKRIVIAVGVLTVSAVLLYIVYLNRYEYFKIGSGDGIEWELRTNRYTNETDILTREGWRVAQTSKEWDDLHWNRTHPTGIVFDELDNH
jgi:hypothetical protein